MTYSMPLCALAGRATGSFAQLSAYPSGQPSRVVVHWVAPRTRGGDRAPGVHRRCTPLDR